MDLNTPIVTLNLEHLLGRLHDHEQAILRLIDADPELKKRTQADGLTIANSAPTLFEPQLEHQLFAKGIVYKMGDEPKLVSIPLVKMFNHTLRAHSDATSQELEVQDGVRFVFPEKLDGTMVQYFAHDGKTFLSTRSILEGSALKEEAEYVGLARTLITELYPDLLDPECIQGLSLTFEMIHPRTKQVTHYGAAQRMVLLAVFDHKTYSYWSNAKMREWANAHRVEVAQPIIEDDNFERGVDRLKALLDVDPSVPEGSIVCFERGDKVLHRVKVKTAEYLRQFSMRYKISLKTVSQMMWNVPELQDWDAFLEHLIQESLSEEEVEAFYKAHFDAVMAWMEQVKAAHAHVHALHKTWVDSHGQAPEEQDQSKAWFKAFALWLKAEHPDQLGHVMLRARRGEFTLQNMMWHMPLYAGFRHVLSEAGVRG